MNRTGRRMFDHQYAPSPDQLFMIGVLFLRPDGLFKRGGMRVG